MKNVTFIRKKTSIFLLSFSFFAILLAVLACNKEENEEPIVLREGRYQQEVYTDAEIESKVSVLYGENTTASGVTKQLVFDFYAPKGDSPKLKRPLIILVVGGGFISLATDRNQFTSLAKAIARHGYAVANIEYRTYDKIQFPVDTLNSYENVVRARADLKSAIRFFRKDASTNNIYKINDAQIFALGHSAGAITSLAAGYMNADDTYNTTIANLINKHGGFEGNSGNTGYPSHLNGVINLSGAAWKRELIDTNEPPLISVHGTNDEIVPYCNGYAVIPNYVSPLYLEGSCTLHAHAQNIGLKNKLITIQNGNHSSPLACIDCVSQIVAFVYDIIK